MVYCKGDDYSHHDCWKSSLVPAISSFVAADFMDGGPALMMPSGFVYHAMQYD